MPDLLAGALQLLSVLLALVVTAPCAYLLLLTLLSARNRTPPQAAERCCFDIIVPAHNEAAGIERTVASLLELRWPADRFRVIVVADNCSDDTAALARRAGATVLERADADNRGKGFALAHAFEWSQRSGFAQAVVVVDADSEVSANVLEAFGARLQLGAHAMQAFYGVLNPQASWRTRLMAIALGSFHMLRSRGRERLRLSCGIRGNGWCVTHELLGTVPYQAFSLVEDVEFGIDIALAGFRVQYCDEARVLGEMVTSERSARSQRRRWEDGRVGLIRGFVPRLARVAARNRSLVCMDLAFDLLVPPLSTLAIAVIPVLVLSAILWPSRWAGVALDLGLADVAALTLYVTRGWQLSETGWRGLVDLARAPFFMGWKLAVMVMEKAPASWVRTDRERR